MPSGWNPVFQLAAGGARRGQGEGGFGEIRGLVVADEFLREALGAKVSGQDDGAVEEGLDLRRAGKGFGREAHGEVKFDAVAVLPNAMDGEVAGGAWGGRQGAAVDFRERLRRSK